jgi:hypothetical protein
MWQPYPLVALLSLIWFVLVILHIINIWAAFGRERVIQHEMDREMELEKLRLQLALGEVHRPDVPDDEREKPKRVAGLSDDGELVLKLNLRAAKSLADTHELAALGGRCLPPATIIS